MGASNGNCYSTSGQTKVYDLESTDKIIGGKSRLKKSNFKGKESAFETGSGSKYIPAVKEDGATRTIYHGNIIQGNKKQINYRDGTINFLNGDVYEGQIIDNKAWGEGNMHYKNGDWYTGGFKENQRSGWGKLVMKNGDIYKGKFLNDDFDGEGEYKFKNGNLYTGRQS